MARRGASSFSTVTKLSKSILSFPASSTRQYGTMKTGGEDEWLSGQLR